MIKLYTSREDVEQLSGIIDVDAAFNLWVQKDMLEKQELDLLEQYEKAKFKDGDLFGRYKEFPLSSVSSGVKTLLLISLHSRGRFEREVQYINITECGSNVLDAIFDIAEGINIRLLLMHTRLRGLKNRSFVVNDKTKVSNVSSLIVVLGNCLGGVRV